MGDEPVASAGAAVRIEGLTTIYGPQAQRFLPAVRAGMGKQELRDRHHHVLGLRDIRLDIAAGGVQVVMGLSGSGKSTLVRHINRLIEPTAGQIWVGESGHEVDVLRMDATRLRQFRRTGAAMVFQRFALFPHLTVHENVAYGLAVRGVPRAQRREHAARWVARVGLQGYEDHFPHQLSGGMQQRVGLARALTNDAPILLMDEPFSSLDPLIRHDMQTALLALQRDIGKTIVFITHDLDEALRLGDRLAILRDGDLVQQGTGQHIVLHPADAHVAHFVRDVNRGRVLRCDSLLRPGPALTGPDLPADLVIEQAMARVVASGQERANVVDREGRHLGVVSLRELVAALLPPTEPPPTGAAPPLTPGR